METRRILTKAKVEWHKRWRVYYALLVESCLDSILKAKLQKKMDYHLKKLKEYA